MVAGSNSSSVRSKKTTTENGNWKSPRKNPFPREVRGELSLAIAKLEASLLAVLR